MIWKYLAREFSNTKQKQKGSWVKALGKCQTINYTLSGWVLFFLLKQQVLQVYATVQEELFSGIT